MAYGSELYVAVPLDSIPALAASCGVGWDGSAAPESEEFTFQVEDLAAALTPAVRAAQLEVIRARFDPAAAPDRGGFVAAATPAGMRRFGPWEFEVDGDPVELGDRWPDDFAAGVSVWSRYFPAFADWRHPHGGSGAPITLAGETLEMFDQARDALAGRIPLFARAVPTVKFRHY